MKTAFAVVFFCAVFALTQAAAVGSPSHTAVQDCQISKVVEMVLQFVADTFALKNEIIKTYHSMEEDLVKCAVSSLSNIEPCITDTVQTAVSTLETVFTNYINTAETLLANIVADVKACV